MSEKRTEVNIASELCSVGDSEFKCDGVSFWHDFVNGESAKVNESESRSGPCGESGDENIVNTNPEYAFSEPLSENEYGQDLNATSLANSNLPNVVQRNIESSSDESGDENISELGSMCRLNASDNELESDRTGCDPEHGMGGENDEMNDLSVVDRIRHMQLDDSLLSTTDSAEELNGSEPSNENTHEEQRQIAAYSDTNLAACSFESKGACDYFSSGKIQVKEVISTHDSIALSWKSPEDQHIDHYVIKYVATDEPEKIMNVQTNSCETHCTVSDLVPATEYEFRIQAVYDDGNCSDGAVHVAVTRPMSPPSKPNVWQISTTSFGIKWSQPKVLGDELTKFQYVAKVYVDKDIKEIPIEEFKAFGKKLEAEIPFSPNVQLSVQIYANCGEFGLSLCSPRSDLCNMYSTSEDMCKADLCRKAKLVREGSPTIYQIRLLQNYCNIQKRIEKCVVGRSGQTNLEDKVVIVVGATGSGKTTLINGMINYIAGVDWKDPFRFKLVVEDDPHHGNQAVSQTSWISSYTIHHREGFKVPYTVTIIDTPGFGDTAGVVRDKEITEQIRTFFTTQGKGGIDHIDAVGFVAQSSLPRLTPTQKYIFDQILSLFGKDIAQNIFLLLTFADGQRPQVLSGIEQANLPYENFFKFNNSALFVDHSADEKFDDDWNFDEMFWKMGQKSFQVFFSCLHTIQGKSLLLTKDVLHERSQLEVFVENIQQDVQVGLNKLEILKREIEFLKNHQAQLDANKEFTYIVHEETIETKPIPMGQYVTNCIPCKKTCHDRCAYKDDQDKIKCIAMDEKGNCTNCTKRCLWSLHKNFPYHFIVRRVPVQKTSEDLRKRYQEAGEKKLSAENLIAKVVNEFDAVQMNVVGMADEVRKSIERLQEIALRPNPLTTIEYLDVLIDSEKHEARPGWHERTQQLRNIRRQVEYMKQVAEKGFDPFKTYREKIEEDRKSKKGGVWEMAGKFLGRLKFWK